MAKQNSSKERVALKDRIRAFKNLPPFFRMIWKVSPSMFMLNLALRVVKAALPIVMLWIGKLIIDEVILQSNNPTKEFNQLLPGNDFQKTYRRKI